MELKIKKQFLLNGLSYVQNIAGTKETVPILNNILLEAENNKLSIKATNMDISLIINIEANINIEGRICVPSRSLYDIAREIDGEEIIIKKIDNNLVTITSPLTFYKLVGIDATEYPKITDIKFKNSFTLNRIDFKGMLNKTIPSMSIDEKRSNLMGIFFEKVVKEEKKYIRMVSTDGHRISKVDDETPNWNDINIAQGIILPRKGVLELKKILDESSNAEVTVQVESNNFVLKTENILFMMRLSQSDFPPYNQAFPSSLDKEFTVDREMILNALRRVSIMSYLPTEKLWYIKFHLNENKLKITSHNPTLGEAEEDVAVEYEGKDYTAGFNSRYFQDALASTNSNKIRVRLGDEFSPALIFNEKDDNYTVLIMPIRF
jgi:DNA polymerase-3 subunit beta